MRIGAIGVGQMGAAIATRWLDAGHEVVGYDLRPEAAAALASHASGRGGAAKSPREAALGRELIAVCVLDDAQVLAVLLGEDGALAGAPRDAVVMIHSTIAAATLRRAADAARERGIALLEAPVSGSDGHRSVGALCVMVGGDRTAFARAKPALDAIGSLVLHLGPLGAGLDAKLVRNLLVYQQYLAAYESLCLAEALGVPRAACEAIFEHTAAISENSKAYLRARGPMAPIPESDGERRRALALAARTARKDLAAALARAKEVGCELPATEGARERMAAVFGVEER
jgi:3-hydroxyisobutyrate dehydrogenase